MSGFFYISILVSAIGAFVFGFSLGFTSPTFLASYEGLPKVSFHPHLATVYGLHDAVGMRHLWRAFPATALHPRRHACVLTALTMWAGCRMGRRSACW